MSGGSATQPTAVKMMKRSPIIIKHIVFVLSLIFLHHPANAHRQSWYEFYLPWNDSTHTTIDVGSLLNDGPAGNHGFLQIGDDGHFSFEDGTRARFFGTNTSFVGNLPSYEDAEGIARRMAKFGINILRDYSDWDLIGIGST